MLLALLLACPDPKDTDTGDTESDTDSDTDTDTTPTTGVFSIDPLEIVIDGVLDGYSKSASFTVTNLGGGDLEIYDGHIIVDPYDAFYFEEIADVTLRPGASTTWHVVAQLDGTDSAEGALLLTTSDPAVESYELPLLAEAAR